VKNRYYISIVGRSNVGKSTLINILCKDYVTSESKKEQTTRINLHNQTKIHDLDVVLVDTPGVSLKNNNLMSLSMKNSYIKSLAFTDLVILMIDININNFNYERAILKLSDSDNTKTLIIVNKIDLCDDNLNDLVKFKENISKEFNKELFFLSLKENEGIDQFISQGILKSLTGNKAKNTINVSSENSMRLSMQELIRGTIIEKTHDELPYDTAVYIEKIEKGDKLVKVFADIYVEKQNQKKIIIGKGGEMIKIIGIESRKILEENYKKKFYLSLNVVVKENWKNNYNLLKNLGYID
jgi:GTP-binding protein Era|tara:strand:- start:3488 stop:4378 length:891 start_codon:yes stop_codon:yes gene_type:complete